MIEGANPSGEYPSDSEVHHDLAAGSGVSFFSLIVL